MYTAKIIFDGESQVVLFPAEIRFSTDEVVVNRIGDMVVLFPKEKGWDTLAQSLELFTEDFMAERGSQERAEGPTP